MRVIASLLSYLFHPLFAPLIALALILNLPIYLNFKFSPEYFIYIYLIFFLNLIAAPLLISLYLKRIGMIQSLEMKEVKERVLPYMLYSIFYAFTYFLLSRVNFPSLYLLLFGAAGVAVALLFLFAMTGIKISAHLTGIGGICGMLIVLSLQLAMDLSNWLILFVLLAGLLSVARLKLAAHNVWEILAGFLLGLGTQMLILI